MAYAKAKLKSNGVKASPCFKTFLIGKMSDSYPDSAIGFILTQYYLPRGGYYHDLQEVVCRDMTGLIQLRIGTGGGHL